MKSKKNAASIKRILLTVLSVVLAIILVVLILLTAYMESMLNKINKNPDDSTMSSQDYEDFLTSNTETMPPDFTGETPDPSDVDWDVNEGPVEDTEHIINIMLIGQDRRPGEPRQRSDVMLLCTINTDTKELTMTSFMRDMYVPIPGYRDNKMNAAYAFGGMKLLNKVLENNFGIHVDGNIEVDFNGFIDIIDLMGGVDIELSQSEANYMNKFGCSGIHAGWNNLNGFEALTHAQNRTVGNGDFSRTERQREVISALLKKSKTMSLTQVNNLLSKMLSMITTDMSNKEIMNYVTEFFPLLKNLQIKNQQIPASGTFKDAYFSHAGSVLLPDLQANRDILKEYVGEYPTETTEKTTK